MSDVHRWRCDICGRDVFGPAGVFFEHRRMEWKNIAAGAPINPYSVTGKAETEEKILQENRGPNIKADAGKPPMGDLPLTALRVVSRVFGHGNAKYEQDNWAKKDVATLRRYAGACLRHLEARQRGERIDPESGLPHLAHAIASLLIALQHEEAPEALDKSLWT